MARGLVGQGACDHGRPLLQILVGKKIAAFVDSGMLKFGPTAEEHRKQLGSGVYDSNPYFLRETSTKDAVIEFQVLVLADEVAFTSGSTVTHYVKAEHLKMWEMMTYTGHSEIGDFPVDDTITKAAKKQLKEFIIQSRDYLANYEGVSVSSEQMSVLMFLLATHLDLIYENLKIIVDRCDGRVLASNAGSWLAGQCRVARYNRDRYKQATFDTKEKHSRWLKALIETRLMHHILTNDHCTVELHYDADNEKIYSNTKTTYKRSLSSEGSTQGSSEGPAKRIRF